MPPRLGIVVPYRDRAAHLAEFIPALGAYLASAAPDIPARILVVEQAPGAPFNQGQLENAGFLLLHQEIDYLCLHDVDTLPVAADYSWPERPSMLVRHGLPHDDALTMILLSGAVLIQKAHFIAANGYSNEYWGWGFEDVDLRERLLRCGLAHENRGGTFRLLPHEHRGRNEDGGTSAEHDANQKQFIDRWFDRVGEQYVRKRQVFGWRQDGLNNISVPLAAPRRVVQHPGPGKMLVEHVVVAPRPPKGASP
jgi:hypothetical protein